MRMQTETPVESPLCRHRVLYIGNKAPNHAKNGLEGIQEPLKLLYTTKGIMNSSGIDAWLTVMADGLELKYVEDEKNVHFPIQNLHYCAAVRFVDLVGYSSKVDLSNEDEEDNKEKFLPLDNPLANLPTTEHPPIFVAILRKCKGVKLLECFAFICTTTEAANSFVRFCFHAYADNMYLNMRNENGARIGKAGELSYSLESEQKEDEKGENEAYGVSRSSSPKPSPIENCSDSKNESKASKRWSNVKSKYSHKLQKKSSSSKFDTDKISSSKSEISISSTNDKETKCDTFKYSFWKNKMRRSRSEINLPSLIGSTKNPPPMKPISTKNVPSMIHGASKLPMLSPKQETPHIRFCRANKFYPDSRYGSCSSFVPIQNPCQIYDMSHYMPHHIIKLVPSHLCNMVPPAPVILCPPVHPLFLTCTDSYNMHRSLYDIPNVQYNIIEEPLHFLQNQDDNYYEAFSNSFGGQYSSNFFDQNKSACNRSTGTNRLRENSNNSNLWNSTIYQKGLFEQHQGNGKAYTVSSKQKKNPNNVSNIFSNDDTSEIDHYLKEHVVNYSHATNHRFDDANVKNKYFSKGVEERIGSMNISDGEDEELETE